VPLGLIEHQPADPLVARIARRRHASTHAAQSSPAAPV
jgi:hypothetical protein